MRRLPFEIVASRLCGSGKPTSPRRQDNSCQPNPRPLADEGVILSRSQPLEGHGSQPSFRGRPSVMPKGPLRALVFDRREPVPTNQTTSHVSANEPTTVDTDSVIDRQGCPALCAAIHFCSSATWPLSSSTNSFASALISGSSVASRIFL